MNILRLKEILREKNISGKDIASKLGVSQNTISKNQHILKGLTLNLG